MIDTVQDFVTLNSGYKMPRFGLGTAGVTDYKAVK